MKKIVLASIWLFGVSQIAIAQTNVDTCPRFAKEGSSRTLRVVHPATDKLNEAEKSMILTTVLFSQGGSVVTLKRAIEIFTDKENNGFNGGTIAYSNVKVGTETRTIASVGFYPGENLSGLIFEVNSADPRELFVAEMIGTLDDGSMRCLTWAAQ